MKNILVPAALVCIISSVSAQEPRWSDWRLVSTADYVRVEYRTKPYDDNGTQKTMVQWKVRNLNTSMVTVELDKRYEGSEVTERYEKKSDLRSEGIYDPSPDFVTGNVTRVSVAVTVTTQ